MSSFTLVLRDANRSEHLQGVTSFVGEDASGHFGILPNHARLLTVLSFGLARFRCGSAPWQYLALPGALLYFVDNELRITTRHYLRHADYQQVSHLLEQQLLCEERELSTTKESLHRMEEALMRRLRELQ